MNGSGRPARGLVLALLAACAPPAAVRDVGPLPGWQLVIRERVPPEGGGSYGGPQRCRVCHESNHRRWRESRHAVSHQTLETAGRRGEPACLRCHATGFAAEGYRPGGREDLASVGCEACHGPSLEHARRPDRVPPPVRFPADPPPCLLEPLCRGCHTARHSPGFTSGGYFAKMRCATREADPGHGAGPNHQRIPTEGPP